MMSLVLKCEELILEAKGISDLLGILARSGDNEVGLDNYSDGIELLYHISFEHYKKIEMLWDEIYSEAKKS